jgi:hypothetical protein
MAFEVVGLSLIGFDSWLERVSVRVVLLVERMGDLGGVGFMVLVSSVGEGVGDIDSGGVRFAHHDLATGALLSNSD